MLTVSPAVALADQQVVITGSGLDPGEVVKVRSQLEDGAGHTWHAEAQYSADPTGSIDLSQNAPLKGSYRGVSAMGLVWAMRPDGDARVYQAPSNLGAQAIHFKLQSRRGTASAQLEQRALSEGVQMLKVEGEFHGVLFIPEDKSPSNQRTAAQYNAASNAALDAAPSEGQSHVIPVAPAATVGSQPASRRPALLVVGGSEGGTPLRRAAWLANHGYVALALAYFHAPGLPDQLRDVPLEYFGHSLSWLAQRPEVDLQKMGVVGGSRGGELALQLGSMYTILHAVVAFVPANVRVQACCDGGGGAAWTWRGQPLAYTLGTFGGTMASDLRAQIAVENTRGPILLISGEEDGVWPSSQMTTAAAARLKSKHFPFEVVRLDYVKAGHRSGAPEIIPAWHGELRHPVSGRPEDLGGTPEGNAASGLDAAPRILEFLARAFATTTSSSVIDPASAPPH